MSQINLANVEDSLVGGEDIIRKIMLQHPEPYARSLKPLDMKMVFQGFKLLMKSTQNEIKNAHTYEYY